MAATDQLLKEVLQQFLPDVLDIFFPEIAKRLDFSRGVRFRDKELFTDFPEGERREPDIVAEVYTMDGDPELILVHAEAQGTRPRTMPQRMWEYYALLRLRTKLPVFPIVVYLSPGANGLGWEEYRESLFGKTLLTFQYGVIGLPDLPADDYASRKEALAVALSAAMRPSKLGRVSHKLTALKTVATSSLDEAKKLLLASVVETFLPLSDPAEASEFAERVASEESGPEVRQMISVYEERGIEKGLAQGVAQGMAQGMVQGNLQGRREMLLYMLETKFGALSAEVTRRINSISDPDELESLSKRFVTAQSLQEMGLS